MAKLLGTSKIRERGVITIPKEARDFLGLKEGDYISIVYEDGCICIKQSETVYKDFKIKEKP